MGGLRRPSISKKIGKHRYGLLKNYPYSRGDALKLADTIRRQGYSVRIVELKTGYFIYHYPQYPEPPERYRVER